MQYIQLQGQVAAQLDLPLEGSYNLFIDTTDNSIKAKDSEGNLSGGGGLSLVEITREAIGELVNDGGLTPGAFYKITGAASRSFYETNEIGYSGMGNEIQDGGTTIILQATTTKTLSTKGIGLFYVPNYENPQVPTAPPDTNYLVWDSTSRLEFSSSFGVFDHDEYVNLYANGSSSYSNLRANIGDSSITLEAPDNSDFFTNPANYPMSIVGYDSNAWAGIGDYYHTASYVAGDCVIWGGRVWQNLSGSVGYKTGGWPYSQLTLNDEDWTKVPFNETNYTIVADLIEYEFEWDNISYRKGANNVEVRCDAAVWLDYWGYNTMKYVPWGHYGTSNISINNSYLDAFVNYPHDSYAGGIHFKDYGGFNAHYWGYSTEIYNISSNFGGHMVSLNLGYNTQIYNITLGIDAYLSDIYTYDNDNGYNALENITIGDNAQISADYDPIYMYHNSYMENLILDTNSTITDINLYNGASIRDSKLGIRSYIQSIAIDDYGDFRQIEIGNSSYIQNINIGDSGCFKRVKLGIDCYIEYSSVGYNGYFKHIEMGDQSYMYCNIIGDNSNFQYNTLGINAGIYGINQQAGNSNFEYVTVGNGSEINAITLGPNCYFSHISTGTNCYINNIDMGNAVDANVSYIDVQNNSSFSYMDLQDSSYIRYFDIAGDCEVGNFDLSGGTHASNFQFGTNSGVGGLNIYSSSSLYNFEIGQGDGFGGYTFTSSMQDRTISKGFNNLFAEVAIAGTTGSLNWNSSMTQLNSNKSFHLLDVNGFDASTTVLNYKLPDGDYEGQTVKFFHTTGATNFTGTNAGNVMIWMHLTDVSNFGNGTNCVWYPFANYGGTDHRIDTPTAVWLGGAWIIDNANYC